MEPRIPSFRTSSTPGDRPAPPRSAPRRSSARGRFASTFLLLALLARPVATHAAVLVELFTAQGCSSCPPADRLLTAMGADPDIGRTLVPLAFHVDYWDTPAWRDRFSNAAWTARQRGYAAKGAQVYTPQMVVAGGKQCVGSDVQCIRDAVDAAAAQPQAGLDVAAAAPRDDAVAVTIGVRPVEGQPPLDVMVALWENGLDTEVKGGENAKKTLHDDYVVRRLERAFRVGGGGAKSGTATLRLGSGWNRQRLGVAVFLQDPKTLRVYGAAAAVVPR